MSTNTECILCGSSDVMIDTSLRNNFKLAGCKKCNFRFASPRPDAQYLENYYNSIKNSRFYKHTQEQAIRLTKGLYQNILKYNPAANRILEIGCSTGYYLYGLKTRGYSVVGTEISEEAISLGRRWYGIELFKSEFPDERYLNSFDVIIIHHVIEHVLDPKLFLEKSEHFLSEKGIIILETPNFNSVGIKTFGAHYPVLCPPGHLNFFDISTLNTIIPNETLVLCKRTLSRNKQTLRNIAIAIISFLKLKTIILIRFNKQRQKSSDSMQPKLNRKFLFDRPLLFLSKALQTLLFPLFFILDKRGLGENIEVIIKRVR